MPQRRMRYSAQNFFWPSFKRRARPQPIRVSCMTVGINHVGSVDAPQLHKCATTILKNNQGKYVRLSNKNGLKLIVDELQDGAVRGMANVEIWKWNNYLALCFKYRDDLYLVTVNGNNLELTKTTDVEQEISNDNSWFQKDNIGMGTDQYSIQTANSKSPTKFLVINEEIKRPGNKRPSLCITLSDTKAANGIFTTPPCQCNEEGCTGL